MKPGFEESQFAVYFQHDLTHRVPGSDGLVLAPVGQMLEARVGFDLGGWLPANHPLWGPLGFRGLPGLPRASWNPSLGADAAVTSRALNVFFQFKRSDYMHGATATYLDDLGGPYWRFRIDRSINVGSIPQHDLLEELERRTKGSASVHYVAPMIHKFDDLEASCDAHTLLEDCVYVAPTRFSPDHNVCAFTSATDLIVNPDPESSNGENWDEVVEHLAGSAEAALGIDDLINSTAEVLYSLGARRPEALPYLWRVSGRLPIETRRLVESYLSVSELLFRARVSWFAAVVLSTN